MRKILLVLSLLSLLGCATAPSQEENEARRIIKETIPTCKDSKECEVKWSAARNWILSNSGFKLQHLTSDFMETYNSADASTYLAVRVQKEPQQDGSYKIIATVWCDNWIGCHPDKFVALKHFNNFVTSSWTQ